MFFMLPWSEKSRFDQRTGNVQSQLLQEVKSVLDDGYRQTVIRGDGQVVVVAFNTITVEIVPVFLLNNDQFIMPDTNGGGTWKTVDPIAQINKIDRSDNAMNGNVRALSQILKLWKHEKNVPIKSFIIELLVAEFLEGYGYGNGSTFWYDYFIRDFFEFLIGKANKSMIIPGTYEFYNLGDDWLSRAQTAYGYAVEACKLEIDDYRILAGEEWQKIFGTRVPTYW